MTNPKYTLVIWNTFEDSPDLYLIPDAPEWLSKCHGSFLGAGGLSSEVGEALQMLSVLLADPRAHLLHRAKLQEFNEHISQIVSTGFIP